MGHLKILDPAFLAQIHPSLKLIKAKQVFPVLYFHVDQLSRGSFQSYRRIQRRGEKRRKHHITASFHILAEIILKDLPVFFRKYVNLVIICQAIRMHPFGMYDLLLWQAGADDGNLHDAGAYCMALFLQADFDCVLSGRNLAVTSTSIHRLRHWLEHTVAFLSFRSLNRSGYSPEVVLR